jgi:adenosylcobyric acid synthase
VVNKFRGDPVLFVDGVRILEERGGVPVVGVIPYLADLGIPEEDAVAIERPHSPASSLQPELETIDIAVIVLPRIANFDDFDPLAAEYGVQVRYVSSLHALGRPHAIILPGTKSTVADLGWLRTQGLAQAVKNLANEGTPVVGICGGYQMLGRTIRDPDHAESSTDVVPGLGLLPAETVFEREKVTHQAQARLLGGPGWLAGLTGEMVRGYEIHMGRTQGDHTWLEITERSGESTAVRDGIVTRDGQVWGCYLHGLFQNKRLRRAWLASLGWRGEGLDAQPITGFDVGFDRLADAVETALDMEYLEDIIAGSSVRPLIQAALPPRPRPGS